MKRWTMIIPLLLCMMLSGCGLFDGSYLSITPHRAHVDSDQLEVVSASNHKQLQSAVEEMVAKGRETAVIHVADFNQDLVERHMATVADHVREDYPIGAYAVESLTYEVGTNSGRPAIAVSITYRHSQIEIQRIRRVKTMDNAKRIIGQTLDDLDSGAVLLIQEFEEMDFAQIVEDYARSHPDTVMEMPMVAFGIYGTGDERVLELTFTYQNSRDALRGMQSQVETIFNSAALYVSGDSSDHRKLSQLYGFLAERFEYKVETSITPAYSLLRHGVGDSSAFAAVYAAICRQAGLECLTVTGSRNGQPWSWNIVRDDGNYYHVDILRCIENGGFREYADADMAEYVWDYSAYPECRARFVETVTNESQQDPDVETQPDTEGDETTAPVETNPEETIPEETDVETLPEESTNNLG